MNNVGIDNIFRPLEWVWFLAIIFPMALVTFPKAKSFLVAARHGRNDTQRPICMGGRCLEREVPLLKQHSRLGLLENFFDVRNFNTG
jgi:hypothetical protein